MDEEFKSFQNYRLHSYQSIFETAEKKKNLRTWLLLFSHIPAAQDETLHTSFQLTV